MVFKPGFNRSKSRRLYCLVDNHGGQFCIVSYNRYLDAQYCCSGISALLLFTEYILNVVDLVRILSANYEFIKD